MYPKKDEIQNSDFDCVKSLILGIRSIREAQKINLKTPLRSATILSTKEILPVKKYTNTILKECNILELKYDNIDSYNFKVSFRPNFLSISGDATEKKLKINMIRNMSNTEINELVEKKVFTKDNLSITFDEVLYGKDLTGFENCSSSFEEFSFILDLKMDPELIEMKEARNFYSLLQLKRKELKLKMEDKRYVYIDDAEFKNLVGKYYNVDFIEECEGLDVDFKYEYLSELKSFEILLFKQKNK